MRAILPVLLLLTACYSGYSQKDTDIFILSVNFNAPKPVIKDAINITNRPGNDKDPMFDTSGKNIYYARKSYYGESDIYVYNIKKRTHTQLTFTRDKESKPQYTFDRKNLTVIIEDNSGDKHLGQIPLQGGDSQTLLDLIDDVSGYTWCGEYLAAVYSESASNLHLANVLTNAEEATQVGIFGATLQYLPFDNSLYFVDKTTSVWMMKKLYLDDSRIRPVLKMVSKSEFFHITSDGSILVGDGYSLFYRARNADNFQFLLKLEELGINQYNHMTLSPDEKTIALVAVTKE